MISGTGTAKVAKELDDGIFGHTCEADGGADAIAFYKASNNLLAKLIV